jgi:hypothetical protein
LLADGGQGALVAPVADKVIVTEALNGAAIER